MIRLTALGTLSLVVALLLALAVFVAVIPLANAQVLDNDSTLGQNTTESTMATSTMDDMSTTGTTSPGLPNTGVGSDAAMNLGILLASGLVVVGGVALLARRFA
jgi:hypothetical protein